MGRLLSREQGGRLVRIESRCWFAFKECGSSGPRKPSKGDDLAVLARQGSFLLLTREHQDRIRSAQVIRRGSSSLPTRPDPARGLRAATLGPTHAGHRSIVFAIAPAALLSFASWWL